MISDTLSDAIRQIEEYQETSPSQYDEYREHIELVKAVMDSLVEALDEPPFAFGIWYERVLNPNLTPEQKVRWEAWCEAGLARWAERLRLLGPVPEDGLLGRIHAAVERQEAMLAEPEDDRADGKRGLFVTYLSVWCFLGDFGPVRRRIVPALVALASDAEAMPVDACGWLGLPAGSTYADGVRAVRDRIAQARDGRADDQGA